jgi:hypothetical protein
MNDFATATAPKSAPALEAGGQLADAPEIYGRVAVDAQEAAAPELWVLVDGSDDPIRVARRRVAPLRSRLGLLR